MVYNRQNRYITKKKVIFTSQEGVRPLYNMLYNTKKCYITKKNVIFTSQEGVRTLYNMLYNVVYSVLYLKKKLNNTLLTCYITVCVI